MPVLGFYPLRTIFIIFRPKSFIEKWSVFWLYLSPGANVKGRVSWFLAIRTYMMRASWHMSEYPVVTIVVTIRTYMRRASWRMSEYPVDSGWAPSYRKTSAATFSIKNMLDRFGQNYNIAQQKKPICSSLSVRRKAQISKIGSTILYIYWSIILYKNHQVRWKIMTPL
jgi:hypothetical protein